MLDQTTPKGRILAAALACAAQRSWVEVSLLDIAEAANASLADLRALFAGKGEIIAALLRAVDDEVLRSAPKRSEGQEKRDLLFDIVMTRFDVLAPHKAALKSIYESGPADLSLAGPYLSSQHWMMQAAGIGTEGATGALRVAGLGLAYASVFRTWLEDDDPGLARTMAALDRRLRSGERALGGIEGAAAVINRLATEGPAFLRTVMRGRTSKPAPTPGPEAGTP
jgi:AcrR family transcriptional regulator